MNSARMEPMTGLGNTCTQTHNLIPLQFHVSNREQFIVIVFLCVRVTIAMQANTYHLQLPS
jgi:hypothetical protein